MRASRLGWACLLLSVLVAKPASSNPAQNEKLSPEQIVERHLNSLGSEDARRNVKTRICEGSGELEILKGGFGKMHGPAGYVAEGVRQALEIQFSAPEYSREALSFTGEQVEAAPVLPGQRSRLGDFLYTYPQLLREGVFGGVYSTNWALLGVEARHPTLHYAGLKKVGGKKLHQLDYEIASARTDLKIRLFFTEKTFQHVRTLYVLTVRYGMRASPDAPLSALDAYTRYEVEETFSDFRKVDGLILPFRWNIRLTNEADTGESLGGRTFTWEWKLIFDQIHHNQPLNPRIFEILN